MKYKYVFIIVTYKNGNDLYDFNESLKNIKSNYKVIIIDNYFDDKYKEENRMIANKLNYDFISTENKGYGSGNNTGIKYALKKYKFDYLIICNSDIIIKEFDDSKFKKNNFVFGPMIKTIDNRIQNPYWVKNFKFLNYIMYLGKKHKSKLLIYFNIIIHKIMRQFFFLFNKKKIKKVSALHGSFIGFSYDVIKKYSPLYDENMFLYNEEAFLSTKFKKLRISSIYYPYIKIMHKEDGSTGGKPINIETKATESFLYYYENYCKKD